MNEDRSSNDPEQDAGNGNADGNEQRSWLGRLSQLFSGEPQGREELINQLKDAHERGVLDAEALAMAEGALEMGELQARDVMIPRSQMVTLNKDLSARAALTDIIETGHSRFPVVGEDKDEIIGVLLAKDLLRCFVDDGQDTGEGDVRAKQPLHTFARPAAIIPESKRLNVLLRDFRGSRNHMAIVVDEYGGVSGLITIEDVLEEIVGDIDDETDSAEIVADIQVLADDHFRVQALTSIEDFNDELDCEISDNDYDTIGGIVVAEFGRVPESGEKIRFADMEFVVTKADERRIHELEVQMEQTDPGDFSSQ